jgi:hypothetical protein
MQPKIGEIVRISGGFSYHGVRCVWARVERILPHYGCVVAQVHQRPWGDAQDAPPTADEFRPLRLHGSAIALEQKFFINQLAPAEAQEV